MREAFRRRAPIAAAILACIFVVVGGAARDARAQDNFDFEWVADYAKDLAVKSFEPPGPPVPEALSELGYDEYRKIRFRPDMALWRSRSLFEIQLFQLGYLYRTPVRINVVANGQVTHILNRPEMFDFGGVEFDEEFPEDLGFAGFRIHYPLYTPDYMDEIAVFLGASYFRILGRDQHFGASARGLAIDTGLPTGEEFPFFREFWLVEPGEHDTELTVYALLDSQRLTGAYEFRIQPATETMVEVRSRLYVREDIDKLGLAPLTSMYYFGENSLRHFDDYRPEVHDSDGLLILNGQDEWIWRPVVNPADLRISAFVDENPRGFGLMQRDRDFANYLDLEAKYHERPSLWVEPLGDWGRGTVELIEIPTEDETNDNVVVLWAPELPPRKGDVIEFSYRLSAQLEYPHRTEMGRTVRTRIGSPEVSGTEDAFSDEARLFVIDFEGGDLDRMSPRQPVLVDITASGGRVIDPIVLSNEETGGWRTAFRLDPEGADSIDVKVFLTLRARPKTESWTYLWTPTLVGR